MQRKNTKHFCLVFLSLSINEKNKIPHTYAWRILVGRGGFEPPKSVTADLQSAPFGRSGIFP